MSVRCTLSMQTKGIQTKLLDVIIIPKRVVISSIFMMKVGIFILKESIYYSLSDTDTLQEK